MAKNDDKIKVSGNVVHVGSGGTFKVEVEFSKDNTMTIDATPSGRLRKYNIRLVLGDNVDVELSPYDLTRGRIVHRN